MGARRIKTKRGWAVLCTYLKISIWILRLTVKNGPCTKLALILTLLTRYPKHPLPLPSPPLSPLIHISTPPCPPISWTTFIWNITPPLLPTPTPPSFPLQPLPLPPLPIVNHIPVAVVLAGTKIPSASTLAFPQDALTVLRAQSTCVDIRKPTRGKSPFVAQTVGAPLVAPTT